MRPVVLFGSITDPSHRGDDAYNGGYKAHALWVKLLRQHGVEAYRVTRDGQQVPWLIEPQPAISLAEAWELKEAGRELRVVTTWIAANEYLELAADGPIWFYDQEMAFTAGPHLPLLKRRFPHLRLATHNRMTQAWYMSVFDCVPAYIPEWSDTDYWRPDANRRRSNWVGWMDEGPHSATEMDFLQQHCAKRNVPITLQQIRGSEQEVLAGMQQCSIFCGLNRGKHELWGEGCPRSGQEAMHTGAVVVAYDVKGNREYLSHGYNGLLVDSSECMAASVSVLLQNPAWLAALRLNAIAFSQMAWSAETRWPAIRNWLELGEDVHEEQETSVPALVTIVGPAAQPGGRLSARNSQAGASGDCYAYAHL